MVLYSKFAYGSQFSGEKNDLKIRYLVAEILSKHPVSFFLGHPVVRRMDYERLTKGKNELPSAFIERVFTASNQAQLDHAPLVARVLVKIITSLGSDNLNRTVKDYLIKLMRENPNIDKKDDILTYIYAVESDETAKQAAERKDRVSRVDEESIQCKVCDKKHKKSSVDTAASTVDSLGPTRRANVGKPSLN